VPLRRRIEAKNAASCFCVNVSPAVKKLLAFKITPPPKISQCEKPRLAFRPNHKCEKAPLWPKSKRAVDPASAMRCDRLIVAEVPELVGFAGGLLKIKHAF
jgi:hypothetical protein